MPCNGYSVRRTIQLGWLHVLSLLEICYFGDEPLQMVCTPDLYLKIPWFAFDFMSLTNKQ
jgi:hypothetical protein